MMKYKNRDVVVLRPVGGATSWADDLVVVRVLESGEEETVRKGEIIGYTEDPKSDEAKKGNTITGAVDATHPSVNADNAKKQLEDHNKAQEQKQKEWDKAEEQRQADVAKTAPIVQTVPMQEVQKAKK